MRIQTDRNVNPRYFFSRNFDMFSLRKPLSLALVSTALFFASNHQASAALLWDWNFSATGISASGAFSTVDTPDGLGFYQIIGITGTRNGEAITGLHPTGTAIPGNAPFNLDNLVKAGPGPQLTVHGFGFSTAAGNYSNPFFASFLATPGYLDYFSAAPFVDGVVGAEDSESLIVFSANIVPASVPAPATYTLMLAGIAAFRLTRSRRNAA